MNNNNIFQNNVEIDKKNIDQSLIVLKIPSFIKRKMIYNMKDLGIGGGSTNIAKIVIKTYANGNKEHVFVYKDIDKEGNVQQEYELILEDVTQIYSFHNNKPEFFLSLKEKKEYDHDNNIMQYNFEWKGKIKKRFQWNIKKNENIFFSNQQKHIKKFFNKIELKKIKQFDQKEEILKNNSMLINNILFNKNNNYKKKKKIN